MDEEEEAQPQGGIDSHDTAASGAQSGDQDAAVRAALQASLLMRTNNNALARISTIAARLLVRAGRILSTGVVFFHALVDGEPVTFVLAFPTLGNTVLGDQLLHEERARFFNVSLAASIAGYVRFHNAADGGESPQASQGGDTAVATAAAAATAATAATAAAASAASAAAEQDRDQSAGAGGPASSEGQAADGTHAPVPEVSVNPSGFVLPPTIPPLGEARTAPDAPPVSSAGAFPASTGPAAEDASRADPGSGAVPGVTADANAIAIAFLAAVEAVPPEEILTSGEIETLALELIATRTIRPLLPDWGASLSSRLRTSYKGWWQFPQKIAKFRKDDTRNVRVKQLEAIGKLLAPGVHKAGKVVAGVASKHWRRGREPCVRNMQCFVCSLYGRQSEVAAHEVYRASIVFSSGDAGDPRVQSACSKLAMCFSRLVQSLPRPSAPPVKGFGKNLASPLIWDPSSRTPNDRFLLIALFDLASAQSVTATPPRPIADDSRWALLGRTHNAGNAVHGTRLPQSSQAASRVGEPTAGSVPSAAADAAGQSGGPDVADDIDMPAMDFDSDDGGAGVFASSQWEWCPVLVGKHSAPVSGAEPTEWYFMFGCNAPTPTGRILNADTWAAWHMVTATLNLVNMGGEDGSAAEFRHRDLFCSCKHASVSEARERLPCTHVRKVGGLLSSAASCRSLIGGEDTPKSTFTLGEHVHGTVSLSDAPPPRRWRWERTYHVQGLADAEHPARLYLEDAARPTSNPFACLGPAGDPRRHRHHPWPLVENRDADSDLRAKSLRRAALFAQGHLMEVAEAAQQRSTEVSQHDWGEALLRNAVQLFDRCCFACGREYDVGVPSAGGGPTPPLSAGRRVALVAGDGSLIPAVVFTRSCAGEDCANRGLFRRLAGFDAFDGAEQEVTCFQRSKFAFTDEVMRNIAGVCINIHTSIKGLAKTLALQLDDSLRPWGKHVLAWAGVDALAAQVNIERVVESSLTNSFTWLFQRFAWTSTMTTTTEPLRTVLRNLEAESGSTSPDDRGGDSGARPLHGQAPVLHAESASVGATIPSPPAGVESAAIVSLPAVGNTSPGSGDDVTASRARFRDGTAAIPIPPPPVAQRTRNAARLGAAIQNAIGLGYVVRVGDTGEFVPNVDFAALLVDARLTVDGTGHMGKWCSGASKMSPMAEDAHNRILTMLLHLEAPKHLNSLPYSPSAFLVDGIGDCAEKQRLRAMMEVPGGMPGQVLLDVPHAKYVRFAEALCGVSYGNKLVEHVRSTESWDRALAVGVAVGRFVIPPLRDLFSTAVALKWFSGPDQAVIDWAGATDSEQARVLKDGSDIIASEAKQPLIALVKELSMRGSGLDGVVRFDVLPLHDLGRDPAVPFSFLPAEGRITPNMLSRASPLLVQCLGPLIGRPAPMKNVDRWCRRVVEAVCTGSMVVLHRCRPRVPERKLGELVAHMARRCFDVKRLVDEAALPARTLGNWRHAIQKQALSFGPVLDGFGTLVFYKGLNHVYYTHSAFVDSTVSSRGIGFWVHAVQHQASPADAVEWVLRRSQSVLDPSLYGNFVLGVSPSSIDRRAWVERGTDEMAKFRTLALQVGLESTKRILLPWALHDQSPCGREHRDLLAEMYGMGQLPGRRRQVSRRSRRDRTEEETVEMDESSEHLCEVADPTCVHATGEGSPALVRRNHGVTFVTVTTEGAAQQALSLCSMGSAEARQEIAYALFMSLASCPSRFVVYDFACSLLRFMRSHYPMVFGMTNMYSDAFHSAGHKACSKVTHTMDGMFASNTSVNEQLNSFLRPLAGAKLSMNHDRLLMYTILIMVMWNTFRQNDFAVRGQRGRASGQTLLSGLEGSSAGLPQQVPVHPRAWSSQAFQVPSAQREAPQVPTRASAGSAPAPPGQSVPGKRAWMTALVGRCASRGGGIADMTAADLEPEEGVLQALRAAANHVQLPENWSLPVSPQTAPPAVVVQVGSGCTYAALCTVFSVLPWTLVIEEAFATWRQVVLSLDRDVSSAPEPVQHAVFQVVDGHMKAVREALFALVRISMGGPVNLAHARHPIQGWDEVDNGVLVQPAHTQASQWFQEGAANGAFDTIVLHLQSTPPGPLRPLRRYFEATMRAVSLAPLTGSEVWDSNEVLRAVFMPMIPFGGQDGCFASCIVTHSVEEITVQLAALQADGMLKRYVVVDCLTQAGDVDEEAFPTGWWDRDITVGDRVFCVRSASWNTGAHTVATVKRRGADGYESFFVDSILHGTVVPLQPHHVMQTQGGPGARKLQMVVLVENRESDRPETQRRRARRLGAQEGAPEESSPRRRQRVGGHSSEV